MQTDFTLPNDTTIAYERRFATTPEKLWEAYTTPELVRQWLGYGEFVTCDMDIRAGGSYRWVWDINGGELEITGEVLEADAPHRLVSDEHMSGVDGPPARSVVEFVADGDATIMRGTIGFANREARDGAYASGMAGGMDDSFTKLDSVAR